MACRSCNDSWREPDEEPEPVDDRDSRVVRSASARGVGRAQLVPLAAGKNDYWGGAQRRMTAASLTPSREDEFSYVDVPGRYTPIGYAKYVSPVVDPYDYNYFRIAGWRMAIPRSLPAVRVRDLLYRVFYYGPQSAGYVRLGSTLVPAILNPGDRNTLSGTAVQYEEYPLSP